MKPVTNNADTPISRDAKESGLIRWISLGLGILFVIGVLLPVLGTLDINLLKVADIGRVQHSDNVNASPYGLCADLCNSEGSCRHVIVPDGWHHGQRVADDVISEAMACH